MQLRFEVRKQLAFLARERGYNEEQLARIDDLLEGIMKLPESLERSYEKALEEYKRKRGTPFISAAERIGLRQGLREGLRHVLLSKYGKLPQETADMIEQIHSLDALHRLYDFATSAATLEEFQQSLQTYLPTNSERAVDGDE